MRFSTADQDILADWTRLRQQGAAKHLPLQAFEVAELSRPVGWFIREALSLAVVATALGTVLVLLIGGVR